jgi:hypothetical protein
MGDRLTEEPMKSKATPDFVTKEKAVLIDVARTIGSALGTVAASMQKAQAARPRRKIRTKAIAAKRSVRGVVRKARLKAGSAKRSLATGRTRVRRAAKKARSKVRRTAR